MHSLDLAAILGTAAEAGFLAEQFGKRPVYLPGAPERFAPLRECIDDSHPAAQLLAERLERTLDADVQIRFAAGAVEEETCAADLFILQLDGVSDWSVGDWKATLGAGDALYAPFGSRICASGDTSRILRAAVATPTGADLLRWLTRLALENEDLRTAIPRFAGPGEQADYMRKIRRPLVQSLRSPALLERYTRRLRETAKPGADAGMPWRDDPDPGHIIALRSRRRFEVLRLEKGAVYVMSGGRKVAFPDEASQMLQFLADRAPVSIGAFFAMFEGEFEAEDLSDFLSVLSREGIIALREPDER